MRASYNNSDVKSIKKFIKLQHVREAGQNVGNHNGSTVCGIVQWWTFFIRDRPI